MGLFSWFRKSSAPDYETLLSRLSGEIEDSKLHLSEIRLRERRWSLLVNAYGVLLWAIWVGLWYLKAIPMGLVGIDRAGVEGKAIGIGGIAAGPFLLWALNRALHFVFARQRNSSESRLRDLLTKQRKHLEDIKKATNYDSTRKLIERYDDSAPPSPAHSQFGTGPPSQPNTPIRKGSKGIDGQRGPAGQQPGTPRAPGHLTGAGGTPMRQVPGTPVPIPDGLTPDQATALSLQMQAIQPVLPTPEKRWYDRVVDSILGEDPAQGAQSKYALVCGECFRHNGLVGSKYEWERMQWICPRCNHLNPSPLSRAKSEMPSGLPPSSSLNAQPASAPVPSSSSKVSSLPSPLTPSRRGTTASPRRRHPAERGTPRSSRLGKEVFSASRDDDEDEDGEEEEEEDYGEGDGSQSEGGDGLERDREDTPERDAMEVDGAT
ncbi:hypothetical protein BD324DRAFT_614439 [Kockovaella imperatae]|uniref:Endoplasmic reticulum junction formation protein lunapark n=1 Tax=Kockovaella imperatae TaxID=4999 RepID=A0A1Y1UNP2_9TREE|nr:hypothetical protein BD324DRAFT_614439 [Kockovaella imperatae]ORX39639.1 hypothetical protein BD324DRAFT_614439 [Kockovaella imperatae]